MMEPSERLPLLKRIASRLTEFEDWGEIDLHLGEFGFPTQDRDWSDEEYPYCIAMLKRGSDEALLKLRQYLFPEQLHHLDTNVPWQPSVFRLFISHLARQKTYATELSRSLGTFGIQGYVAHEAVTPGREWVREILAALRTCDGLVALLHDGFAASDWADQEVGIVLGRAKFVISVRVECDPYGFLGTLQGLPGRDRAPKEVARELAGVLITGSQTKYEMRDALVERLCKSISFEMSNSAVDLLRQGPGVSEGQYLALRSAQEDNPQVQHAFNVGPYLDDVAPSGGT